MNEILKPREPLFPLSEKSVMQVLKEISSGTVDFLSHEERIIIGNRGLYEFLLYRKPIAESFLDGNLYMRGALFTHRVLRVQAEEGKIDLPQVRRGLGIDDRPGLERRLLTYYNRRKDELGMEESDLAIALEAISGFSSTLSVIAGAIDVYFPLRTAIENR